MKLNIEKFAAGGYFQQFLTLILRGNNRKKQVAKEQAQKQMTMSLFLKLF
jgi:hypothetical protein